MIMPSGENGVCLDLYIMCDMSRKKWYLIPVILSLMALIIMTALIACSNRDDHEHPRLKSGEDFFNHHCAECHGEDGTGKLADQTPANILTRRSREGIVNYVTTTINPRREMPVFSTMPYSEAVAIASHLLKLQQVYEVTPDNMKKPLPLMIEP